MSALHRQSLVLLEDAGQDNKLSAALAQIEELQKELTMEKEQRVAKEASLAEEIDQLQETAVAQENKSMLLDVIIMSLYKWLDLDHLTKEDMPLRDLSPT